MSKYVAVKIDDEIQIHLPHTTGNYYTLCGLDGADEAASVNQSTVNVPKGAKVNCVECLHIWELCKQFSAKDFERT